MLILIKQIVRKGADFSRLTTVGINPDMIDSAAEGEVPGFDKPCVALRVGDETIFCEGTVEEIVKQTWYPPCPEPEDTDTA